MANHELYNTPDGFSDLIMESDGEVLTGLHFVDAAKMSNKLRDCAECELSVFRETRRWLDEYFAGKEPDFTPQYRIDGLTSFRKDVIDDLLRIPYGATVSYGDIAKRISKRHGGKKVSARAVGGAVGWNPICIIIPCHRVIGAEGGITGYGGGLGNKISLLAHEGSDMFDVRLSAPRESKAEVDGVSLRRCIQAINHAAAQHGLGPARLARDGDVPVICLDDLVSANVWKDAPFIFDKCSDEDAKLLLETFIKCKSLCQYDLALQLSRLMARKGALVRGRMGRIISKIDWKSYAQNGLLLSYLASKKASGAQICRLLDEVPEDGRDGIFLACWYSPHVKVQKTLKCKFEEWIASDDSWGVGTSEEWWLSAFLSKWTRERIFSYEQLQFLTQWYLDRRLPEDL